MDSGEVASGYDGCNGWGRSKDDPNMIISDLQECQPDPLQKAYRIVIHPDAWAPQLRGDGRLVVRARGHELVFRREEGS